MKGGFYGLKLSQVSLILIGFVCVAVLMLAWTKTTILDPPDGSILHLTPDLNKEYNEFSREKLTSDHLEKEQDVVEKSSSISTDTISLGGNDESETRSDGGYKEQDVSALVSEGAHKQDVPETKSSSKLAEDDFLALESSESRKHSESSLKGNHQYSKAECNFAKGKWIVDDSRPLYSGFGCKQWLAPMWACRLTQRLILSMRNCVGSQKLATWKTSLAPSF